MQGIARVGKGLGGESEVWISGSGNFRKSLGGSIHYKGSRKDRVKPAYFQEAGEYLKIAWGARETDGIEADDAIAIGMAKDPKGRICVSYDKDLMQCCGWHCDFRNGRIQWVSRKAADFNLYNQIIAGDSGDDVPGIRGLGRVKAAKILEGSRSSTELCERAWGEYKSRGLSADYFKEVATLVYLLKRPDDSYQPKCELI